jgi:hypothetical protein
MRRQRSSNVLNLIGFLDYTAFLTSPELPIAVYHTRNETRNFSSTTLSAQSKLRMSTRIILFWIPDLRDVLANPNVTWTNLKKEDLVNYLHNDDLWTANETAEFELAFSTTRIKKENLQKPNDACETFLQCIVNQFRDAQKKEVRNRFDMDHLKDQPKDMDHLKDQPKTAKGFLNPIHWAEILG